MDAVGLGIVERGRLHPSIRSRAKRAMDIAGAITLLLLTAPLLLAGAVAVALSSGLPIVFRRRCVGLGGAEFDAFKLRTMRVDADAILARDPRTRQEYEAQFKLANDARITRVGRVLRRWSIDELPQLVNVVRGEMSLVGPRMITQPELAKYGARAPDLLNLRPGITGLWQVSGRQEVSYEQRVALDLEYVNRWSLMGDVVILLRTPLAVLSGRGAR